MNVLLITADQWRGDCMSAVDHPCVETPNIDALIEDGVLFRNHYSVSAPCAPARASLLTGMYQQNHRVVRNGTPLDERHTNLAQELRKQGYKPTLFGYTDTSLDPRYHPEHDVIEHGYENVMAGFDEGLLLVDGQPTPWLTYLQDQGYDIKTAEQAYEPVANYPQSTDKGYCFAPPVYSDEHSQTAFLTRKVIEHIDQCEPGWCIHLSYLRPHPPFIATEPWNLKYRPEDTPKPIRSADVTDCKALHPWLNTALGPQGDWFAPWIQQAIGSEAYDKEVAQIRASYYGLVSKVDHYLGKLFTYLKTTGQYDDTLIVLTSDHGELLGDQWLFGKRGFFDTAYHIPLIIRDPRQAHDQRGRIESHFTESVDVMPTILDALAADIPRQCDGQSLMGYVNGTDSHALREMLHWEYDFRDVENPVIEQQLGIEMDQCQMNVIRDDRYKYVHFTNLPPLFFDLKNDPAELNNLADDPNYAKEVLRLSQAMLSWRMNNDERTLTHINVSRDGIHYRQ